MKCSRNRIGGPEKSSFAKVGKWVKKEDLLISHPASPPPQPLPINNEQSLIHHKHEFTASKVFLQFMQCDLTKIQTIINLCTCIVNFHVEEILVGCWFRRVVLHKLLPKSLNLPEVARMIYINFLLTTRFFLVTPLDSMGFQSTAMDFTG